MNGWRQALPTEKLLLRISATVPSSPMRLGCSHSCPFSPFASLACIALHLLSSFAPFEVELSPEQIKPFRR